MKKLEQRSTELRQRFYSENDSFVRDNQVKPEWDRVTDRLQKARAETETARQQLANFLDDGRRAGALPGWLREGEEQEPPAEPVKKKNGMPAPLIRAMVLLAAPLVTIEACTGETTSMSLARIERIGPALVGTSE